MKQNVPDYIKNLVPYKPGKPIEELERELGVKNSVKMASNENPLGPSKLAISALKENLESIHFYPEGGCFYLKRALSKKLNVDEENLFFGNGSNEVIEVVAKTFMTSKCNAVMAESAFLVYKLITNASGAKAITVPLKNYTHDLPAMADAIDKETRVVFIANPNNPTGTIVKKNEMEEFLKRVPQDVLVVSDEAYFEYAVDPEYPDTLDLLKKYNNLLIMRTFSKIYALAGLRIGYAVGSKDVIDLINRVRQPFNVNTLAQVAAKAALEDDDHVSKSLELIAEGKSFLYQEFEKLDLFYVETHTNFILVKIPDTDVIYDKLLHMGVIVRLMKAYDLPEHIRVTIGTRQDNERFIDSLKKLLK